MRFKSSVIEKTNDYLKLSVAHEKGTDRIIKYKRGFLTVHTNTFFDTLDEAVDYLVERV